MNNDIACVLFIQEQNNKKQIYLFVMSLSLGEGSFALLSLLLLLTKLLFDMSNLLLRQSTNDRGECKRDKHT